MLAFCDRTIHTNIIIVTQTISKEVKQNSLLQPVTVLFNNGSKQYLSYLSLHLYILGRQDMYVYWTFNSNVKLWFVLLIKTIYILNYIWRVPILCVYKSCKDEALLWLELLNSGNYGLKVVFSLVSTDYNVHLQCMLGPLSAGIFYIEIS